MWANTCWGLLGLAATLTLSVLGLSRDYLWLQPLLLSGAAVLFVASIFCFCWPLRSSANRKRLVANLKLVASWGRTRSNSLGTVDGFPIAWSRVPVIAWTRSVPDANVSVRYVRVLGKNIASHPVRLHEAYLMSDITGSRLRLKLALSDETGTLYPRRTVLPTEINPIPPEAVVSLVTDEFRVDPSKYPSHIPENEFLQQWGRIRFFAEYDGTKYTATLDEESIKKQLANAHSPPPKPHVTERA